MVQGQGVGESKKVCALLPKKILHFGGAHDSIYLGKRGNAAWIRRSKTAAGYRAQVCVYVLGVCCGCPNK